MAAGLLLLGTTATAITLESAQDRYRDVALSVLLDPAGGLSFEQVRQRQDDFVPSDASPGFSTSTFWFYTTVTNASHAQRQWLLLIDFALLDFIDLYWVDDRGQVTEHLLGDRRPFVSRSLQHRMPNVLLDLPTGRSGELYVRVQSSSSVQMPLELLTITAFQQRVDRAQAGFGILYGTLLALLLYNLTIYIAMRDPAYIYYSIYVGVFIVFQAVLNGFAFQYWWPNSLDWANRAVVSIMPVLFIAMAQFCRSFLLLKRYAPAIDRLLLGLIGFYLLLLVASFYFDYRDLVTIETGSLFFLIGLIIVGAILVLVRGYRPALYFLIAWSTLFVGMAAYAGMVFGVLPQHFMFTYGFQIGSAAEMILLSFALAYRINVLREENQRIAYEANASLEQRVNERTAELSQAHEQLEKANARLEQASQRDGLTKVFNRRYLDTTLETLWRRSSVQQTWLGLIIMDLDRFKQVNDRLGHLAGDDCLKSVAESVQRGLVSVEGAMLARFGGEEFFVLLPDHAIEDARSLAENLRQRLEQLEIRSGDERFFVTASFGVAAMLPSEKQTAEELIRRADQAMYEAKNSGRNRVVAAAPKVVNGH